MSSIKYQWFCCDRSNEKKSFKKLFLSFSLLKTTTKKLVSVTTTKKFFDEAGDKGREIKKTIAFKLRGSPLFQKKHLGIRGSKMKDNK